MSIILRTAALENAPIASTVIPEFMLDRGKVAVLIMLIVASALAAFGWWWNYRSTHKSLEFWETDGALTIRDAAKVEVLRVGPPTPQNAALPPLQSIFVGKTRQPIPILEIKDVSQVPGMVHARHSLLTDASFDWEEPDAGRKMFRDDAEFYAIRFDRNGLTVTLLFLDFDGDVLYVEQNKEVTLSPKSLQGWTQFIRRHYPARGTPPTPRSS